MKTGIAEPASGEQQDSEASTQLAGGRRGVLNFQSVSNPVKPLADRRESKYISFCETYPNTKLSQSILSPTVFHEEWWLNAATNGAYSVAEVTVGGRVVGRLPFLVRRRLGFQGIWTPPLTHFLGPGIDEGNGSRSTRFLRRIEITRELISKLPQSSWQCIRCHGGITDVIAFQEEAFKTYVQFTHEIPPQPTEHLWQQMRDKTRNVIRRAEEQLNVAQMYDVEEFILLYEEHLSSRHVHNSLDLSAIKRLLTAALERKQGRILGARNLKNEIVAANFCAWDSRTSFYVACTRRADSGNGATSLLLWQAIQHASLNGRTFDFSGLGTRGSVLHYADFGADIGPRFVAVRATGMGKLAARARVLMIDEHYLF